MKDNADYKPEADLLIKVAEQGFFLSLSPDTKETIALLLRSMFLVDQYLDSLPDSFKKRSEKEILSYLQNEHRPLHESINGDTRHSLQDLKVILFSLSERQQHAFLNSVIGVFENGKAVAAAKTSRDVILARKREAIATADMIITLIPEIEENKRFSSFLRDVTIAESLLDSIKDARKDKRTGEISVRPVHLYFHLATGTLKHTAAAARAHPRKLSFLLSGADWTFQHVKAGVTNRAAKLGRSPIISRARLLRSPNRKLKQAIVVKSLLRPFR